MRTLAHSTSVTSKRLKYWRLFFFCLLTMLAAIAATIADAKPAAPEKRDFWVWDLNVMPPGTRRASATLRASGERSLIYVEEKLWNTQITPAFVRNLSANLEFSVPNGAYITGTGIVPLEENLFGALPDRAVGDERLIVLFADLGKYKDSEFDGFFNSFDQLLDKDSMERFHQHSNESNIIYLNGFRKTEAYTTGVIAHELQHLLASSSAPHAERENWLSEALAEGAMLLTGYYGDQDHVNRFARDPGKYPLVTPTYVQYGPQLLFSSFLIDSLPHSHNTAIGYLTRLELNGRDAVERLFRDVTDAPPTFDSIFSNFVSYVFSQSEAAATLPNSWHHSSGIVVPRLASYFTFEAGSGELTGRLAPYSFVAIDLAKELPPSAIVKVERINSTSISEDSEHNCSNSASVLWKPVTSSRLAVYAVGCDPGEKREEVQFRLRILDQPSLQPPSPFRILP